MFKILDGRTEFYQWDLNRKIVVDDASMKEVHFCNRTGECSLVRDVYEVNGLYVADVPNLILQDNWDIKVYGFDSSYTKHSTTFNVVARTRPENYVYTEDEQLKWEQLEERIDTIEENGVSDEVVANAVEKYMDENDIKVDLTGYATEKYVDDAISTIELTPGPAGKDGKDGVDGKDGYTPVKGVDYFDGQDGKDGQDGAPGADGKDYVLTDADKQEIAGMVEVTGGGSGESVEEVYIGTDAPTDDNYKIWIDLKNNAVWPVDGSTILQDAYGKIYTALGGAKVLVGEAVQEYTYQNATGVTRYGDSYNRIDLPSKNNGYYGLYGLDATKVYDIEATIYDKVAQTHTDVNGKMAIHSGANTDNELWSISGDLKNYIGDMQTRSTEYAIRLGSISDANFVWERHYITKFIVKNPPVYEYQYIDSNMIKIGAGLAVDGDGALKTTLTNLSGNAGTNTILQYSNDVSDDGCAECAAFGSHNSVGDQGSFAAGYRNWQYGYTHCISLGQENTHDGYRTTAIGQKNNVQHEGAIAIGSNNIVSGYNSYALGEYLHNQNNYRAVLGRYNDDIISEDICFVVGIGASGANRINGLTINEEGNVVTHGTISNGGADYAEYFEWADGNPEAEDRIGLMVTLDGNKIRFANADDDVLGIVSGTAAILGDDAEWAWQGKYLRDEYGRYIYHDVEVTHEEEVMNEDGEITTVIVSDGFRKAPTINPEYNEKQSYVPRADRAEWDIIGMVGKLYLRDDGTCVVNGYAVPGVDGVATLATGKSNMRVMERISDNIVRVLLK